jgi:hypothetical protein
MMKMQVKYLFGPVAQLVEHRVYTAFNMPPRRPEALVMNSVFAGQTHFLPMSALHGLAHLQTCPPS